jgi:hypothetical protein
MSELSNNMRATVSNMVRIYEELTRLFLDADDLMTRNGHRVLRGSALEAELSRSLNFPRWWLMFAGSRYYIPEDDPQLARAIGVFLYDARHEPIDPILVLGAFRGAEAEDIAEEINPAGVLWEAWNKGTADRTLGRDLEVGAVRAVSRGIVRGVLLEEIGDFQALEELVISPLLELKLD